VTTPAARDTSTERIHEEIAIRAHQIWEAVGRPSGAELQHWLQAEKEIAARHFRGPARVDRSDPKSPV